MKESSWLYSTYIMYVPRNKALRSGLLTHGFLGGGFKYFLFLPLPYLEKWSDLTYFANGLKPPQVSLKKALLRFMKTLIYFVSGGTRRKTEGSGGRGLSTQGLYAWLVGQRVSWKMNDDDFRITTSWDTIYGGYPRYRSPQKNAT